MTKIIIGVSLDEYVLSTLDEKRGLIPRSKYLEFILIKFMRIRKMGKVYSCGHKFPIYLVTYLVSNLVSSEQKTYSICENCEKIPCFSIHVIRKIPLQIK